MGSTNAMLVANKVLDTIREGKLVNKRKIIESVGYSKHTATVSPLVTNTKTYKAIMERASKPLLERLDEQINKTEFALSQKNLKKEDVKTLIFSLDILIKNKQILSGGITSLNVFVLPSEVMQRNDIKQTKDRITK